MIEWPQQCGHFFAFITVHQGTTIFPSPDEHAYGDKDVYQRQHTKGRLQPRFQAIRLHWVSKTIHAYKHVPYEVYRRLCSVPNPTTYWEDRIVEEYSKGTPIKSAAGEKDAAKKFGDLFGGDN